MKVTAGLSKFAIPLFIAVAALAGGSPAPAQDLKAAVKELAKDIADYMKTDAEIKELSLGSFTAADASLGSNSGASIKRLLGDELAAQGIAVKPSGARFSCKGEFTFFDDGADKGKVTIEATMREKNVKKKTFSKDVFEVSDVAALIGGTGQLSTDPAPEKQTDALIQAVQNPQPEVRPSPTVPGPQGQNVQAVAAEKASYAIEIWRLKADKFNAPKTTEADYEPLPIDKQGGGVLFVNLEQENRYAIRLINNTDRLAAATLTIDGLNMFAFSEIPAYKALGKVLVPPGPKGVLIKGWHRTNDDSFSFEVADVGEAAVSKVGEPGLEVEEEVGVITARFAVAVDLNKGENFPSDELLATKALGTKIGQVIGQSYRDVKVKIGSDREVISIRYSHPLPDA